MFHFFDELIETGDDLGSKKKFSLAGAVLDHGNDDFRVRQAPAERTRYFLMLYLGFYGLCIGDLFKGWQLDPIENFLEEKSSFVTPLFFMTSATLTLCALAPATKIVTLSHTIHNRMISFLNFTTSPPVDIGCHEPPA